MAAPTTTPIVGLKAKASFTPTAGTEIQLKNTHWTLVRHVNIKDAHNTTDGLLRVKGMPDASGTVEGLIDATALIDAVVSPGDIGTLKLYTDGTKFYSLPAILGDFTIDSAGTNDLFKWSFPYQQAYGTATDIVEPV